MDVGKKIPLARILKGKFLKIAKVQDLVILELLRKFDFILHGGTAVWRIYRGKRFSYDIDIYHRNPEEIATYLSSSRFFSVERKKLTPSNVLYLKLREEEVVELEASPPFREFKTVEGEFALTDGSSVIVKTLSPEELVREKVEAFIGRRKARDLYDIFYLLDFCRRERVKSAVSRLLPFIKNPPKDFEGLEEIILIGKAPSFGMIREKVKRYAEG